MKSSSLLRLLTFAAVTSLIGCSGAATKSPDVTDNVRKALDQANLHDVKVSQDRDKGVVTLTGEVRGKKAKTKAGELARSVQHVAGVNNNLSLAPGYSDDAVGDKSPK